MGVGIDEHVDHGADQFLAGGTFQRLRPIALRALAGIDDQKQQAPQVDRFLRPQRRKGRGRRAAQNGHPTQPVIVDQSAIEQLDVFHVAVVDLLHSLGKGMQKRRRGLVLGRLANPTGQRRLALAGKCFEDDRRERGRHRGGSGDRLGDLDTS